MRTRANSLFSIAALAVLAACATPAPTAPPNKAKGFEYNVLGNGLEIIADEQTIMKLPANGGVHCKKVAPSLASSKMDARRLSDGRVAVIMKVREAERIPLRDCMIKALA